jgi:shikimate dehydrogenase
MIRTGLVGYPLSHSLSPRIHAAAFKASGLDGEYRLFPVKPDGGITLEEMTRQLRRGALQGLNVTIPYKQTIIPFVDALTPSAQAIGAVNTLYMQNGQLIGHNTDVLGFLADLVKFFSICKAKYLAEPVSKKAIVMGAGGAARAVVYGLRRLGWNIILAFRESDAGQAAELIRSFDPHFGGSYIKGIILDADEFHQLDKGISLVINATPVGMFPEIENSPWPSGCPFPIDAAVYDVVYNPCRTRLVRDAQSAGLNAVTGLGMLVEQAALSFACWTGCSISTDKLLPAVEALC